MTLQKYAIGRGFDILEKFEGFKAHLEGYAKTVLSAIKCNYPVGSGMYYPANEILEFRNPDTPYIIQILKGMGVEFRDGNELFRY